MLIHPFDNIACEHMFLDRHFDTQSGPIKNQTVWGPRCALLTLVPYIVNRLGASVTKKLVVLHSPPHPRFSKKKSDILGSV